MKKKRLNKLLAGLMAAAVTLTGIPGGLTAEAAEPPAALDIGHPTFKNTEYLEEVYDLEGLDVSYASDDIMMQIYQQDLANGGDSFYMDRVLAREGVANGNAGSNGNDDGNTFLTRGRALYMYTSNPGIIGFGGTTAYHQPLTGNMYSITFQSGGEELSYSEDTSARINYPSNWVSTYNVGDSLEADVTKFISNENVAVTAITLRNTSGSDQTVTVNATSGFVSEKSEVEINGENVPELTGSVTSPSNLTEITTRLTGDGFGYTDDNTTLSKEVTVPAGESVDLKVVMAFTTEEIPESTEDYVRFSELSNLEAIRAQKAEYNLYWAENLPYVDVPNDAVQKAIDYRWWSERFNSLDANIPGYDYQYPVTIEGVLGYNNAIILTQPMHLQDTKWLRSAYLPYGQLLSAGNSSQSSAFLDNPGNRNNWNNHYGQYLAEAGLEAFYVIGGGEELAENLAYYFGHDATGQLEHYGNHTDYDLIAYQSNYMTGNDADTISMNWATGVGQWKIHGENAYVWAAADAAAELYGLLGNEAASEEYSTLADSIQEDVLNVLWCEQCQKFETYGVSPTQELHNPDQPNLVELTESNNYNYFSVGLVPTDETSIEKYKEALKAFTNGEEFPIFPFYTANQVHNQIVAGSNNFSNINFTVQARLYESALRTYDKEQEYITDDMLSLMVEWMAWNIYPDSGDVRYPNNNEFYNIDGRTLDTYYRSWIYHNVLGNYNYIFFEDMAGIQPRADEKIELSPIDFSYDHFMVNNARYHGHDLTVVWDDPTDDTEYYDGLPEGYSLYVDGELAFTLGELAHVIYDSESGALEFPDGDAQVITDSAATSAIPTAMNTQITDEKVLEMFEKSGIHGMTNIAEGAEVTASYTPSEARAASWAEKHRADGTDPTSTAVNETVPDPQAVTDGMTVNMPFWGNYGSANTKDSLVLNLGSEQTVDMASLYFYNDRQEGGYSEPAKYTVEYWDGTAWQHVENQTRSPGEPKANYNTVLFKAVTTDQLRFTFTNKDDGYTAVTEIQLFSEGGDRPEDEPNTAPQVELSEDITRVGNLRTAVVAKCTDDGKPYDKDTTYQWEVVGQPEDAITILGSSNKTTTTVSGSVAGDYTLRFTMNDGELATSAEITVTLEASTTGGGLGEDVAPSAETVESDYTSSWENLNGINNEAFEPSSSNVGTGQGWGNWSQSPGSEHYVGYIWNSPVTVGGADIYWYDDGGGTRIPASFRIEYLDASGEWQDANITTPYESAVALNQYNTIYFDPITTTQLRLYMVVHPEGAANGIYRFKVYTSIDIDRLDTVEIATSPGVVPTLPESVDAWTSDGALVSVPVTWDTVTADMVAGDGNVVVNGINSSTGKMTTATIYVRSDMDVATISTVDEVEVTTEAGVVPNLPRTVKVGYNNGARNQVPVTWPTITSEDVSEVGEVTFQGDVEGTTQKALLTVNVVKGEVDKSRLEETIAAAEALNEADYTAESFAPIKEALAAAEQVMADEDATQNEVDNARTALETAMAGRVGIKDALNQAIAKAEELDEADYEPDTWAPVADALAAAKEIQEKEGATEDEINAATEALTTAMDGLVRTGEVRLMLNLEFETPEDLTLVKDSSENAFDSTATGIKSEDYVAGVSGTALQFNGETTYDIPAGDALADEDITLSYWIKRTGELSGDNPILWAKEDSTWNGNGFYTNYPTGDSWSSFVCLDGFNGFYVDESPNTFLPEDEWTHVAVTWDSATRTGKIYKNGVEQPTSVVGDPASITGAADAVNRMGESGYPGAFTSNLALDEFKVYSGAMDEEGIQSLYKEFDENASLTLNLKFEKPEDLTLVEDSSENGFDSTATGIVDEDYIDGVSGTALQFNGATSYDIPAGGALASENLSMSYWIKRTGELSGDNPILWAKQDSTYNGNGFYTNYPTGDGWSSFVCMDGFNGFYVDEAPDSFLPENEWTHVVVTWDAESQTGKIYKNGVEQPTSIVGDPASITGVEDAVNRMGENGYPGAFTSNLALDEFKIYSEALSTEDVTDLYNEFKPAEEEVDKTALSALYNESVNIDTSLYTAESAATFTDALNTAAAVLDNAAAEQADVDAALAALQAAIAGLEPIETPQVDKSALQALFDQSQGIDSSLYTEESVAALAQGMADAAAVLADESATQEEVNAAVEAFQAVIDGLELKQEAPEINYGALQALVESCADIDLDKYTEESAAGLSEALAAAQAILENGAASQEEVDTAATALQAAINGLIEVPVVGTVDKNRLESVIAEANGMNAEDYTGASWADFTNALQKAEDVLKNVEATQEEVDAAADALQEAMDALVKAEKPAADTGALTEALEAVKNLNKTEYTEESWAALEKAVADAYAVLDNADATQEEIDAATEAVYAAITALERTTPVVPEDPGKPSAPSDGNEPAGGQDDAVKTGDTTPVMVPVIGMICAVAAVVLLLYKKRYSGNK